MQKYEIKLNLHGMKCLFVCRIYTMNFFRFFTFEFIFTFLFVCFFSKRKIFTFYGELISNFLMYEWYSSY